MATHFELKQYQQASLGAFESYLSNVNQDGANVAFYKSTNLPYRDAPIINEGVPYVCLRIPTGGGKTILASHTVGVCSRTYMQSTSPMVLWLVPSTPILDQTVNALKNINHPYRVALAQYFGRNISVLIKSEALAISRADAEGGACIIVSTIQSFRRDQTEGLKVYEDAGALMDHFSALSTEQKDRLKKPEGIDRPTASLANVLRLHRPMVIVDEAHNVRTPLSFDTLATFDPCLILELTATPETEHNPSRDKFASNILHSVSAAELKAEEMIKLPIRLTTDSDWQKTVGSALDCQLALEQAANAERQETGEYIRPIILFQAQSANKNDKTRITYAVIEKYLIEDKRIPKEQIAIHSGTRKDLDSIVVDKEACEIRYIITVAKLKEGWDCPFAYILCSVAEQVSKTAIEQILGRILRLPKAKLKRRDALNRAYAYVASDSFDDTARKLKDGLVEGAGFDPLEADQIISPQDDFVDLGNNEETEYTSDVFQDETQVFDMDLVEEVVATLPITVRSRVTLDSKSASLAYKGTMSHENRNVLHLAFSKIPKAESVINELYAKSNNIPTSGMLEQLKTPFIVPLLGYRKQNELQLFTEEQYLDLPWRLDECDAKAIVERFSITDESQHGEIDINEQGKVGIDFVKKMQSDLFAVMNEPAWTLPRLANWIDSGIRHRDVTKPSATLFISNAIEALQAADFEFSVLARYKYELRNALLELISDFRKEREQENYNALFETNAEEFATSSEIAIVFDEQRYAFNQPYKGSTKFNKHYMSLIGDLKPSGEEFECAVYLDRMSDVKYWVRNVEKKLNSFWLQLPHGRFYPDFVALLNDGRILVVEYKGAHLHDTQDSQIKRKIGDLWAATSDRLLFCMPTNREFGVITAELL